MGAGLATVAGELALWIALAMALWTAVVPLVGARSGRHELTVSGYRALHCLFALLLIAAAALVASLYFGDFSMRYVASYTSHLLPPQYRVAALWASEPGALLLVALCLSGCVAFTTLSGFRRRPEAPYTIAVIGVLLLVLISLVSAAAPFAHLDFAPSEGIGLRPGLQSSMMLLHPPLLALGYAVSAMPFALSVASMMAGKPRADFPRLLRGGTLAAWIFLSVAIAMGMWWNYVEPDATYWSWSSPLTVLLLPWLGLSACIAAAPLAERRMFAVWNTLLVHATFALLVAAVISAPGGVAVAGSKPGVAVIALLVVVGISGIALGFVGAGANVGRLESILSREGASLVASVALVSLAAWIAIGVFHPGRGTLGGNPGAFSAAFFVSSAPLLAILCIVVSMKPLLAWNRTDRSRLKVLLVPVAAMLVTPAALLVAGVRSTTPLLLFATAAFVIAAGAVYATRVVRAAREVPGVGTIGSVLRALLSRLVLRAGTAVLLVGLASSSFNTSTELTVNPAASAEIIDPLGHRWTFTNLGVSVYNELNRVVTAAAFALTRNSEPQPMLRTSSRLHVNRLGNPEFTASLEPALYTAVLQDMHVVLTGTTTGQVVQVRVVYTVFASAVWFGLLLIVVGAPLAGIGHESNRVRAALDDLRGRMPEVPR